MTSTPTSNQAVLAALKAELGSVMAVEREKYFGKLSQYWVDYAEENFWNEDHQAFRLVDLQRYGIAPGAEVLDLAAGCGQFVLHALQHGYSAWGIEPSTWKTSLVERKWQALGLPEAWRARMVRAIGEDLPFADDSFDAIYTHQTLEHVQHPDRVIGEMLRVVRPGGGIYIRCPDYRSTYEAHYRIAWLPLFPRPLARLYLRLRGRPVAGLETIRYVTRANIIRCFETLARQRGWRIEILDDNQRQFRDALARRGLPQLPGLYLAYRTYCILFRELFRVERSVNLFIRILAK